MLSSLYGVAQTTEAELSRAALVGAGASAAAASEVGHQVPGREGRAWAGPGAGRRHVGRARWAVSEDEDQVQGEGAWVGPGEPCPRIRTSCGEEEGT